MSESTIAAPAKHRWRSLDGLRGVAALVVVFHHSLLLFPAAANLSAIPRVWSLLWWVEFTPFKLVSAGTEAVLVFFVLSGFVLVVPVIRQANYDWIAYYFRRIVRLYLPVVASVVFATLCILVSHQSTQRSASSWLDASSVASPDLGLFLQALDIFEPANPLNNPLWTLRWEMIFSLALPLFTYGAVLLKRRWVWVLFGAFVLVFLGTLKDVQFLLYLPVFLCGSLLAVNADRLVAWRDSISGRKGVGIAWFALLSFGLTLLILHWLLQPFLGRFPVAVQFLLALSFVGAVVVVAVAFLWTPFESALTVMPIRWLGRVSFSLYLVHVPIIVACANIFGPNNVPLAIAVGIPVSLLVAEIFARFVEGPAHRLSRRVGSWVGGRVSELHSPAA